MTRELLTLAEQSGFTCTGRSDEVERLCAAVAARWPQAVRAFVFGRSSEGRDMWALLVTRSPARTAAALRQAHVPLLLLQPGIHPGESDGKDAGFIALRELLQQAGPGPLDSQAILFVPAFNVDGHERTGRWNRPNQNGPQETGWRTTARNLNLNRDYCKADAPEMQALRRLVNDWDPLVCVDLHVTDGADFQPDISLQVEPLNQGDCQLHASARALRDGVMARLSSAGSMPLPFYPDFFHTDDPASGFVLTVFSPRFSTGYFPQRNRFTLLVETHCRTRSAITGKLATVYDPGTPQIWRVPYRDRIEPAVTVRLPKDGYLVPAAYAHELEARLRVHGLRVETLPGPIEEMDVEGFRASSVRFATTPFEGRMRAQLDGQWLQFEQWLHRERVTAADPAARLEFFLPRHASWDERYNLYPVFRTAAAPGQNSPRPRAMAAANSGSSTNNANS